MPKDLPEGSFSLPAPSSGNEGVVSAVTGAHTETPGRSHVWGIPQLLLLKHWAGGHCQGKSRPGVLGLHGHPRGQEAGISGLQVPVQIPFQSHQWWRGLGCRQDSSLSVHPSIHPYTRLAIRCYGKTWMNFLANTTHPFLSLSIYPSLHPSTHLLCAGCCVRE